MKFKDILEEKTEYLVTVTYDLPRKSGLSHQDVNQQLEHAGWTKIESLTTVWVKGFAKLSERDAAQHGANEIAEILEGADWMIVASTSYALVGRPGSKPRQIKARRRV